MAARQEAGGAEPRDLPTDRPSAVSENGRDESRTHQHTCPQLYRRMVGSPGSTPYCSGSTRTGRCWAGCWPSSCPSCGGRPASELPRLAGLPRTRPRGRSRRRLPRPGPRRPCTRRQLRPPGPGWATSGSTSAPAPNWLATWCNAWPPSAPGRELTLPKPKISQNYAGSARTRHRSEIRGRAPGAATSSRHATRAARPAGGPQGGRACLAAHHPARQGRARAARRSPPSRGARGRTPGVACAEYVPKFGAIKAGGAGTRRSQAVSSRRRASP